MTVASVTDAPETTERDEAAEIMAGYAGDEAPATQEGTPSPSPEPTPTPQTPEPVTPAAATSLSEQQVKDLLAGVAKIGELETTFGKKYDQAFGHIGQLQKMLKDRAPDSTPGSIAGISEEDFKELKKEFPELSTPLLKELIPVLNKLGHGESVSMAQISEVVAQATLTVQESIAKDLLTDRREDWEEIVGPKDSDTPFRQWLAVQPLDYQEKVRKTWRPGVMVKAIESFEAFQQATAPPPTESTDKAPKSTTAVDRQARLTAAVAPKGTPAPVRGSAKTADEEMRDGFNSA